MSDRVQAWRSAQAEYFDSANRYNESLIHRRALRDAFKAKYKKLDAAWLALTDAERATMKCAKAICEDFDLHQEDAYDDMSQVAEHIRAHFPAEPLSMTTKQAEGICAPKIEGLQKRVTELEAERDNAHARQAEQEAITLNYIERLHKAEAERDEARNFFKPNHTLESYKEAVAFQSECFKATREAHDAVLIEHAACIKERDALRARIEAYVSQDTIALDTTNWTCADCGQPRSTEHECRVTG